MQGHDTYSIVIADVLSVPSLHTPITVGLYAKWGSGKSLLISKLIGLLQHFEMLHCCNEYLSYAFVPSLNRGNEGFHST